jgi:RNA-dependent RNA polymerase
MRGYALNPRHKLVFQSRLAGIKGLFVRIPDDDFKRITEGSTAKLAYRPSMFKYDNGPLVLEINAVNKVAPGPARLNIQFIIILLSLGVKMPVCSSPSVLRCSTLKKCNAGF